MAHFPEDLVFQVTGDRTLFQGRYVLRHAFEGGCDCDAGRAYRRELRQRREAEAQALADLTGWDLAAVGTRAGVETGTEPEAWWWTLWRD